MAVKRKDARWSQAKRTAAAAGKAKAQSDRKLQRQAEQRRKKADSSDKQEGAVQGQFGQREAAPEDEEKQG